MADNDQFAVLSQAYHNFIRPALSYLQEAHQKTGQMHGEQIIAEIERTTDSFLGEGIPLHLSKTAVVPSYHLFVIDNFNDLIQTLKEVYLPFLEQLALDPMLGHSNRILAYELSHCVLSEIAQEQGGFDIDAGVIERQFQKLQSYLASSSFTYKDCSVFKNLELEVGRLDLDSQHSIRVANTMDKDFFRRDPAKSSLQQLGELEAAFFEPFLEVTLDFPKKLGGLNTILLDEEVEKVLLAMRLFKGGAIGVQPLFNYSLVYPNVLPFSTAGWQSRTYGQTKYTLSVGEGGELQQFWPEFQKLYPILDKKLGVAKERFMSSYEQAKPLNRLLDLVIGLESTFSENAESISYKFALRAAVATGQTVLERSEIFRKLKLAYNMRSKVAHGDDLPKEGKRMLAESKQPSTELEEFIEYVRRILARAIVHVSRWQIANPAKPLKEFLPELDEALLSTATYPNWRLL